MEYLDKAAESVESAKTEEKIQNQYDFIKEVANNLGLSSVKRILNRASKEQDFNRKGYFLYQALHELDDIVTDILELNLTLPDIMDSEDRKALEKQKAENAKRVHELGAITFEELTDHFVDINEKGLPAETAVIVFKKDCFLEDYTEEQRSYRVSSDNKWFRPNLGGMSLFGSCLDGTDQGIRIDLYMRSEEDPWRVDYCRLEA